MRGQVSPKWSHLSIKALWKCVLAMFAWTGLFRLAIFSANMCIIEDLYCCQSCASIICSHKGKQINLAQPVSSEFEEHVRKSCVNHFPGNSAIPCDYRPFGYIAANIVNDFLCVPDVTEFCTGEQVGFAYVAELVVY